MAYYRLYFFDGPAGRIGSLVELQAHNDASAIAAADAGRRLAAMELWCGGRKVHCWPALFQAAGSCARPGIALS